MKIAVLHLSDIHIKGPSDRVIASEPYISSAAFEAARHADATFIVVTGDVAQSGKAEEYEAAEKLLHSIWDSLSAEAKGNVHVVVVPGNHDCALAPNKTRDISIDHVAKNPAEATNAEIVATCTAVQSNFFKFRDRVSTLSALSSHPLWTEYSCIVDGDEIRFSAINAAWMSRIPETAGSLIFPAEQFDSQLNASTHLRFALMHHPLNWYCQHSYHPLRKALLHAADILMSGHEHSPAAFAVESSSDRCVYIEAGALQPHKATQLASFSVLEIDTDENFLLEKSFELKESGTKLRHEDRHNLVRGGSRTSGLHPLTRDFSLDLIDPGGKFVHPGKDDLSIEDIFIDPNLKASDEDNVETEMISSLSLLNEIASNRKVIIYGEDKAGKTTVLRKYFRVLHDRGFVPVYIRASEVNVQGKDNIRRLLKKRFEQQYERADAALQSPKEKLVALLDDLDRIKGAQSTLADLVEVLGEGYSAVIATASSDFEYSELVSSDAREMLEAFHSFELQRFGHQLRHLLVKKWSLCGKLCTTYELDEKAHRIEGLLNEVIGKNLVPANPFYLLILLQSFEAGASADIQNSGIADYYQFLITKSLGEVGIHKDELGEYFNYLAQLAWLLVSTDSKELCENRIKEFDTVYCDKFYSVDLKQRLQTLVSARILTCRGGHYSFSYPYALYFFLGQYLAKNFSDPSVQNELRKWYGSLHRRESANAILFLCHNRSDSGVIDELSKILRSCFDATLPLEFNGDIAALNVLITKATTLVLAEPNVQKNQLAARGFADSVEANEEDDGPHAPKEKGENEAMEKAASDISLSLRAANLLSQIIKNNYGSLERPVKRAVITEVIAAPLRILRYMVEMFTADPEVLVSEIEKSMKDRHSGLPPDKLRQKAQKVAFGFFGAICTGFILRTGQLVGSERISADLMQVARNQNSNAYRLVELASQFSRPGRLDLDKIRKLSNDVRASPFAFTVLQSLGAYHIYMYETREEERQKLCSILDISLEKSQAIEFRTRKNKALRSS